MLAYLSKEKNEAIQKSIARSVALNNSKKAREKARREAAVLREEKAKERARERAEKLEAQQQKKEEKAKVIVRKRNDDIRIVEKVRYVTKSGSLYYGIPRKIMNLAGWKLYTRFAYTADPEKHVLVLEESIGEPTVHQITLCSSGCITVNNNICHEVGWNAGDTILVKHEDKKIIMRRVA